jgi:hypothetical protein
VPTNGPTQANEASENVSPMSSAPAKPPFSEDRFNRVRMGEGILISKAPSRLSANARNNAAMNPSTHGLEPSVTTPNGPSKAVVSRPSPENSTTIPRQKIAASATLSRRPPAGRLRK